MKTIEYYLEKGFPPKEAAYFANGRRTITGVTPEKGKTLLLQFDNGETRRLDMRPIIQKGGVFAFLSCQEDFNRVYLDEENCVSWDRDPEVDSLLVWDNKIDLSPEMCYLDSRPVGQLPD